MISHRVLTEEEVFTVLAELCAAKPGPDDGSGSERNGKIRLLGWSHEALRARLHAQGGLTETEAWSAERAAKLFHETYERLAPCFGYETRPESAKPWPEVPDNQRRLMAAVAYEVLGTLHAQALAEKRARSDLNGAVLRAARELRNATRNLVREDEGPEARQAWDKLDHAINERDDYMVRLAQGA